MFRGSVFLISRLQGKRIMVRDNPARWARAVMEREAFLLCSSLQDAGDMGTDWLDLALKAHPGNTKEKMLTEDGTI